MRWATRFFYGRGAGKLPTASAVVSDVIEIAKSGEKHRFARLGGRRRRHFGKNSENSVSKHFARVKADDKESVKAEIEKSLTAHRLSTRKTAKSAFVTDEMTAKRF
ncbi:MAG: hypothetical protein L6V93_20170 [Clostridiales bacterium]|nr:MAG: hypothetical protein L6V93_20170 [Clostridiales bacterium]